jgi:glutamate carboxypeptidase
MLEHVRRLVEIESPTQDLDACHKVVAAAAEIVAEVTGITPRILDEQGRPVLVWGSDTPRVLLLTHLDTVWPIGSFEPLWQIEGDVARGPGIFDMKAGFVQAVHALKGRSLDDGVTLLATTDEETGSAASLDIIKRLAQNAEAVLVTEASADGGALKVARKGTSMWRVHVQGRAAHAGLEPEKGINATLELAHLALQIAELSNLEIGTTVVPTVVAAGTTLNTVPAEGFLDVDSRAFSIEEQERVNRAIFALTPTLVGAQITVTGGINRPPMEKSMALAIYDRAVLIGKERGLGDLGSAAVGGASDGNFTAALGTPTLDGLGAVGRGAHASDEHIIVSELPKRAELLHALVTSLLVEPVKGA